VRAEVAGLGVAGGQHAEDPRPQGDRDVDERADALALDEHAGEAVGVGRVADVGAPAARDLADHPLADAEAPAPALVAHADGRHRAQVRGGRLVAA
jgi:hypothetical protein